MRNTEEHATTRDGVESHERTEPTDKSLRPDESDSYDPHEHRNRSHPNNNVETLVHLLKSSLGTGILAIPQAFSKAGLITGIVGTILAGLLITHCLRILIRAQYFVCKRKRVPLMTYPESASTALLLGPKPLYRLATPVAQMVDIFIIIYQLGVCCVYIVFIAENNKKLLDPVKEMSLSVHMVIILLPLVALNLIPNLKLLAPLSLVANILSVVALAIVVYYMLTLEQISDDEMDMWGTVTSFPLFFGTALFALSAVGLVVTLENNMKTPKAFGTPCGVLNIGMTIIVVLYLIVGSLGYNYCISECEDSITLNLPDSVLARSVIVMYTIAIFLSYALNCYVPVEILWRDYVKPRLVRRGVQRLRVFKNVLRVSLCILTFLLAVAVPRLGLFISLFGALCLSALGLCFPSLMDLCCTWPHKRLVIYKDVAVFIIGLILLVLGTVASVYNIVISFL